MLSFIIWTIVIYLLIRFIFNFVIPIVRVSGRMRSQVREFQEKVNRQYQEQPAPEKHKPKKADDYIDFEEIK
jgi:predicted Holliday junction resolvase-like endonuclease